MLVERQCIFLKEVLVMSFAEDIKKMRRKAFMTQEDFAKELGVSFATVNRWETGKAKPNLKTMKLIDEYCKKTQLILMLAKYQIDG